jgi:hypothetical protein
MIQNCGQNGTLQRKAKPLSLACDILSHLGLIKSNDEWRFLNPIPFPSKNLASPPG